MACAKVLHCNPQPRVSKYTVTRGRCTIPLSVRCSYSVDKFWGSAYVQRKEECKFYVNLIQWSGACKLSSRLLISTMYCADTAYDNYACFFRSSTIRWYQPLPLYDLDPVTPDTNNPASGLVFQGQLSWRLLKVHSERKTITKHQFLRSMSSCFGYKHVKVANTNITLILRLRDQNTFERRIATICNMCWVFFLFVCFFPF